MWYWSNGNPCAHSLFTSKLDEVPRRLDPEIRFWRLSITILIDVLRDSHTPTGPWLLCLGTGTILVQVDIALFGLGNIVPHGHAMVTHIDGVKTGASRSCATS